MAAAEDGDLNCCELHVRSVWSVMAEWFRPKMPSGMLSLLAAADKALVDDKCSDSKPGFTLKCLLTACRSTLSKLQLSWWKSSICCGPPGLPGLFRCTGRPLGAGSTSEVFEWVCNQGLKSDMRPEACDFSSCFEVYTSIDPGEHVAVKCFDYSMDCIGSFSAGSQAHPPNYPTKLTTGIKERILGAKLTRADGPGKSNVCLLLASWFDQQGLWLVFRLVPAAKGLDDILAPSSPSRVAFCAQPVEHAAGLFRQFALALQYLGRQGIVHRDGGLANWLLSGVNTSKPQVTLIDFGLSLCTDGPLSEPDTAQNLLGHLCATEPGLCDKAEQLISAVGDEDLNMDRLNPIDWCYAPGAAGPKFPPPPEVRVLREELPISTAETLRKQGCQLPYSNGYDVWVLGWTFMQIVLGERWEDWKDGHWKGDPDDPVVQHVRSCFFDKNRQVPVPWELGSQPPAWRLAVLASGAEGYKKGFLDEFLRQASSRILSRGLDSATPLQAAFVQPDSRLRSMIVQMVDFDATRREAYLQSGALLQDLEDLENEHRLPCSGGTGSSEHV